MKTQVIVTTYDSISGDTTTHLDDKNGNQIILDRDAFTNPAEILRDLEEQLGIEDEDDGTGSDWKYIAHANTPRLTVIESRSSRGHLGITTIIWE